MTGFLFLRGCIIPINKTLKDIILQGTIKKLYFWPTEHLVELGSLVFEKACLFYSPNELLGTWYHWVYLGGEFISWPQSPKNMLPCCFDEHVRGWKILFCSTFSKVGYDLKNGLDLKTVVVSSQFFPAILSHRKLSHCPRWSSVSVSKKIGTPKSWVLCWQLGFYWDSRNGGTSIGFESDSG